MEELFNQKLLGSDVTYNHCNALFCEYVAEDS